MARGLVDSWEPGLNIHGVLIQVGHLSLGFLLLTASLQKSLLISANEGDDDDDDILSFQEK